MPRTLLFNQLQRGYRLARESLRTGETAQEVVERAAEAKAMSRRQFVGISAAGAAALLLDGCVRPGYPAPRRGVEPVLIVGAGIAGLTAGHRLRQRGIPVRIAEAQDRVGGRMWSLRGHFADGQVAELGGELIDTPHTHIRRLAHELAIPLDDLSDYAPGAARDVWFFEGRRHTEADVVAAFVPVAAAIQRELATLAAPEVTATQPNGGQALDRTTLAEWLERNVAERWFRTMLIVAYTTEYGLEPGRQSALSLILMLQDEKPGSELHIFGESDERFHTRGGNDRIPAALGERLSDAIETGTVLEAVSRRADGSLVCAFQRGGGRIEIAARHVVLALPFTLLRTVRMDVGLPPAKRRAIDELGYGTNAKLMVGFSDRPWLTAHRTIGSTLSDLPCQLTWETSRAQAGTAGILTNFTGGRHGEELGQGSPAEQAARLVADLERVYPGIGAYRPGDAKEARFHWPTFPWTRGSYASYLPGQWSTLRGIEGQSVGNLHFAGEHCSLSAQGFMEGGCETGEAAAAAIVAALATHAASPAEVLPLPAAA